jgi:hypothetical protein
MAGRRDDGDSAAGRHRHEVGAVELVAFRRAQCRTTEIRPFGCRLLYVEIAARMATSAA